MRYTNIHHLPDIFQRVLDANGHEHQGDITVTQLVSPPRIHQLRQRHPEIEIDIASEIWKILGIALHRLLEQHAQEGEVAERRLYSEVAGYRISGQFDFWCDGVLDDYKLTSVWSTVYNPTGREEWVAQLNLNRWLCQEHGVRVRKARLVSIMRDWVLSRARREQDYPVIPVAVVEVPIWPQDKGEAYLEERVEWHRMAAELPDDQLPLCTSQERWQRDEAYAVMKRGNKQATAVFRVGKMIEGEARVLAEEDAKRRGPLYYVDHRLGSFARCEDGYCEVAKICNVSGGGGCHE